jgi:hypothetical protein
MSQWCGECKRTPYIGCDKECPIFGLDFEELEEKYFNLLNNKTETEEIPDDEDLLPDNCLYIKGFLTKDCDGIPAVSEHSDYYMKESIIGRIENYAERNGFFARTNKGLGGKRALIEDCSMRAYFTKEKSSLYEAQMGLVNMMYGGDMETKVSYVGYSEWTITGLDLDKFTIGGHDLTEELQSHYGEYMHLIIEC